MSQTINMDDAIAEISPRSGVQNERCALFWQNETSRELGIPNWSIHLITLLFVIIAKWCRGSSSGIRIRKQRTCRRSVDLSSLCCAMASCPKRWIHEEMLLKNTKDAIELIHPKEIPCSKWVDDAKRYDEIEKMTSPLNISFSIA